MVYLLFGDDDYSLHLELNEIKKSLGEADCLEANTSLLEGQRLTVEQLSSVSSASPFLCQKRLVVVEGLLGRYERRYAGQRNPPRQDSMRREKEEIQAFANYARQVPESTLLVLVDGKINGNNPLLKALSPVAVAKNFAAPKREQLQAWIRRRVEEEGGTITPGAAILLAEMVGDNLWTMANEINKLILFASGRRITESDVKQVAGYTREASVFTMFDAILKRRAALVQRLLRQLLDEGAGPSYILSMMNRQVRMIILAKEFIDLKMPAADIQVKLGLTQDWATRKVLGQARSYSFEQLEKMYGKLLETDIAVKTGKYSDELALDLLVTDLCCGS